MKYLVFLFAICLPVLCQGQHSCQKAKKHTHSPFLKAENTRSDSIDILHYDVRLDVTDFNSKTISGETTIRFKSKINGLSTLPLDLINLEVSEVLQGGIPTNFTHNGELLSIELNAPMNEEQTDSVTVIYGGSPLQDPSGWGGWYWSGNYAFNLGVGFGSYPHNYGRVWHPCFDSFAERATYSFHITTPESHRAFCPGIDLGSTVPATGKLEWHWNLTDPIPTYLASVAVSTYQSNTSMYSSITNREIPMQLAAEPGDMNNLLSSFVNLPDAMEAFENRFGPYVWQKVGFNLVPFGSGAMEHATSIAYPQSAANGGLSQETLMAHELSHHWFGNLITCSTEADMWINEGFASYCERIFTEWIYGRDAYDLSIRNNHMDVLRYAHIVDGDHYALHGVPTEITYGDHTYNKGADIAHNLRGYLGDELFFSGLSQMLTENAMTDMDAYEFRDKLEAITGVSLQAFFDNWIFNPGYPSFAIDSSLWVEQGDFWSVTPFTHQQLNNAPELYTNVPLSATFLTSDWTEEHVRFTHPAQHGNPTFQITNSYVPGIVYLNGDDKLSQATTGTTLITSKTFGQTLDYSFIRVDPTVMTDSIFFRVDHHWVPPTSNAGIPDKVSISQDRFWSIIMHANSPHAAEGRIYFNATNTASGNFDFSMLNQPDFNENQLVVLYREHAGKAWEIDWNVELQTFGSEVDCYGFFDVLELRTGQYTFGYADKSLSVPSPSNRSRTAKVYPNPATTVVRFEEGVQSPDWITLFSAEGKLFYDGPVQNGSVDVSNLPDGNYFLKGTNQKGDPLRASFSVQH